MVTVLLKKLLNDLTILKNNFTSVFLIIIINCLLDFLMKFVLRNPAFGKIETVTKNLTQALKEPSKMYVFIVKNPQLLSYCYEIPSKS